MKLYLSTSQEENDDCRLILYCGECEHKAQKAIVGCHKQKTDLRNEAVEKYKGTPMEEYLDSKREPNDLFLVEIWEDGNKVDEYRYFPLEEGWVKKG